MNSTTISDHNHTFPESLVLLSQLSTYPRPHPAPGLGACRPLSPLLTFPLPPPLPSQHSPAQPRSRWRAQARPLGAGLQGSTHRRPGGELTFHQFSYRTKGPEMTGDCLESSLSPPPRPVSLGPAHPRPACRSLCAEPPGSRSGTRCWQCHQPPPPAASSFPRRSSQTHASPWGRGTACSQGLPHTQTPRKPKTPHRHTDRAAFPPAQKVR